MNRIAFIAIAIVALSACSSDISRARQLLEDSLTITTDLEFQQLQSHPGNVVCGSFSAYISYSEPRVTNQPFIVVDGVLNKAPTSEEQAFYCSDDQAAVLYDETAIGPFTADNAELIQITADLTLISNALEAYYRDNFYYPTAEQGLQALVEKPRSVRRLSNYREGGYLPALPVDPWGHAYRYTEEQWGRTKGSFEVSSLGLAAERGGEGVDADVSSTYLPYLQHLARTLGVD